MTTMHERHGATSPSALAAELDLDRYTLRRWIARGTVPGPDLQLLNGRRAYSPQLRAEVIRLVEDQYRPGGAA